MLLQLGVFVDLESCRVGIDILIESGRKGNDTDVRSLRRREENLLQFNINAREREQMTSYPSKINLK